eukprot:TRINITY_DN4143_c0_g1_i1.p1 TRINITY_DN4143_c0_g1~~TRINITY_DN4143_c0_g1_i1.p1  ORF type:complete len:702 (-),score=139.80 TRINITY_DN4143_c0_g1_i1:150-2255(-)
MGRLFVNLMTQKGVLGKFDIQGQIARGGNGELLLAVHRVTSEKVVIKVTPKDPYQLDDDVKKTQKMQRILKLVKHPRIIQLLDIQEDEGKVYYIQEYAPGGDLRTLIANRGHIDEAEACKYFQQLISSVEYLHKLGVVHQNITTRNILIDESGSLKLIGIRGATSYSDAVLELKLLDNMPENGTPEGMLVNVRNWAKLDIWLCGVVLYTMLCGHPPFDASQPIFQASVVHGTYEIPTHLSRYAKDLLTKILITDPEERYTFEQIRAHPWFLSTQTTEIDQSLNISNGEPVTINDKVLAKMRQMELDVEKTKADLRANNTTELTMIYYLLQNKMSKENFVLPTFGEEVSHHIDTLSRAAKSMQDSILGFFSNGNNQSKVEDPNEGDPNNDGHENNPEEQSGIEHPKQEVILSAEDLIALPKIKIKMPNIQKGRIEKSKSPAKSISLKSGNTVNSARTTNVKSPVDKISKLDMSARLSGNLNAVTSEWAKKATKSPRVAREKKGQKTSPPAKKPAATNIVKEYKPILDPDRERQLERSQFLSPEKNLTPRSKKPGLDLRSSPSRTNGKRARDSPTPPGHSNPKTTPHKQRASLDEERAAALVSRLSPSKSTTALLGPLRFRGISKKNAASLLEEYKRFFTFHSITFIAGESSYELSCEKDLLRFQFSMASLREADNLVLVSITRVGGEIEQFADVASELIRMA